jgi:hypothetical protein
MIPSLYLSSVSLVAGIWLLQGYSSFRIGEANPPRLRWFGPNTFFQYLELYGGVVLFLGVTFALILASVLVYWFNWPSALVAQKMRGDSGMLTLRRESQRSAR